MFTTAGSALLRGGDSFPEGGAGHRTGTEGKGLAGAKVDFGSPYGPFSLASKGRHIQATVAIEYKNGPVLVFEQVVFIEVSYV